MNWRRIPAINCDPEFRVLARQRAARIHHAGNTGISTGVGHALHEANLHRDTRLQA
jgi:hypothetical protein